MDLNKLTKDELVAKLQEAEEQLAKKDSPAVDDELARIKQFEKERSEQKRVITIPEEIDPELVNTWQCSLNGKIYLIPRGVPTEVPVAVAEIYDDFVKNNKAAIAGVRKHSI